MARKQKIRFNVTVITYAVTGNVAHQARFVTPDAGFYVITANDAILTKTVTPSILAAIGVFAVTGNDATLTQAPSLSAVTGAFVWTGNDASLVYVVNPGFVALTGNFAVTGNDAVLTASLHYTLDATTRSFAYTLNPVTMVVSTPVTAGFDASLLTTGYDLNMFYLINQIRVQLGLPLLALTADNAIIDEVNIVRNFVGIPFSGVGSPTDLIAEINQLITDAEIASLS